MSTEYRSEGDADRRAAHGIGRAEDAVGRTAGATRRRIRPGTALAVSSVLLFLGTLVVGAALAPPVDTVGEGAIGTNETVVGVQGDPNGRVEVLNANGTTTWTSESAKSYHDVSVLPDGTILASYVQGGRDACGPYESPCSRTGFRILDRNASDEVVHEWSYPVRTGRDSEVHDAERLPTGEFVVADMEYESVFTVDPETGERTWTWNASDHYDAPADPTTADWLHINDVDRIGEDRYLVSVRNANQLLVVERGEGENDARVVEVINEDDADGDDDNCVRPGQVADYDDDGDVACGDPEVLNHQHNPQWLGPGKVLVADSENDRVVELHRIEGEWRIVWEVREAGGIGFDWPRDADRLPNGNTLVTDTRNNRVVEIDESGAVVWSAGVPGLPYEADRGGDEYPAGPPYDGDGDGERRSIGRTSVELPVFDYALSSLRHVAPVPYWVSQWHLLAFVLALVGVASGVGLNRYQRRQKR
ncbi:arylsulfotransferase family protein [Halegenticoccus tardaugens]|uniref:arylsulfotransferase family protein n=1 Tax=Halegenticoccus tardaugens TaxID=2071624 RepID=UPI001E5DB52A|nr:arylsulfotransferase family protein [Halegenticoccus tardaugens]